MGGTVYHVLFLLLSPYPILRISLSRTRLPCVVKAYHKGQTPHPRLRIVVWPKVVELMNTRKMSNEECTNAPHFLSLNGNSSSCPSSHWRQALRIRRGALTLLRVCFTVTLDGPMAAAGQKQLHA